MKIRLFILIGLLVCLSFWAFSTTGTGQIRSFLDRDTKKAQKFEVVFTVKYNSMTLAGAAAKEATFRDLFKDACDVKVELMALDSTSGRLGIGIGSVSPQQYWIIEDDAVVEVDSLTWKSWER